MTSSARRRANYDVNYYRRPFCNFVVVGNVHKTPFPAAAVVAGYSQHCSSFPWTHVSVRLQIADASSCLAIHHTARSAVPRVRNVICSNHSPWYKSSFWQAIVEHYRAHKSPSQGSWARLIQRTLRTPFCNNRFNIILPAPLGSPGYCLHITFSDSKFVRIYLHACYTSVLSYPFVVRFVCCVVDITDPYKTHAVKSCYDPPKQGIDGFT